MEEQEQQPATAPDEGVAKINAALQKAGIEGATVSHDSEAGYSVALAPQGDEKYPESLTISLGDDVSRVPVEFMADQFKEMVPEVRLYAAGTHPAQTGDGEFDDDDELPEVAVFDLNQARSLVEVGPEAEVLPCTYAGIESFKGRDDRTMRIVLTPEGARVQEVVRQQPAEA